MFSFLFCLFFPPGKMMIKQKQGHSCDLTLYDYIVINICTTVFTTSFINVPVYEMQTCIKLQEMKLMSQLLWSLNVLRPNTVGKIFICLRCMPVKFDTLLPRVIWKCFHDLIEFLAYILYICFGNVHIECNEMRSPSYTVQKEHWWIRVILNFK